MIYVTSDLHGYSLEKFKDLLNKVGFCDDDFLYILGDVIDRGSDEYQKLLDNAYEALSQNSDFEKALKDSSSYTLAHSIGKTDVRKTVLTEYEFISRLERMRITYE